MFFLKPLQKILRFLARRILLKYQPSIIAVVGSIGKTSTKEALYCVLRKKFKVRRNPANYNNEIGLPLAVIGQVRQARSFWGWLKICFRGFSLLFRKDKEYPRLLILEMAADKPGDLLYLLDIIPSGLLKGVVLTGITPVHMEFYGNFEKLFQEKTIPLNYLKEDNFLAVNRDDCDWPRVREKIKCPFLSYGLSWESDVRAEEISYGKEGIDFQLICKDKKFSLNFSNGLADYQLYPLLAAVAVALFLGLDFEDIIEGLKGYKALPGRMNKLKGIRETVIIDDSYNSSPVAARKAVRTLMDLPFGKKRIAVLGDMLELGNYSQFAHQDLGRFLAEEKPDYFIAVGDKAKEIFEESRRKGFSREKSFYFKESEEAAELVKRIIEPNDVILVKGSRGICLEKLVKKIMAYPEEAESLLVKVF
jgi:UDP-N-acetylmuramoyl-tripeptide--D-alanyl-D-alanine ligase